MQTPFDRLAKNSGSALLQRVGKVETQAEVVADAQWVDLTYDPEPDKLHLLAPFGLIARMVEEGPGQLEFFHAAPSVDDVLFCMQKQTERRRKRADPRVQPAPRLWIIAAGRPRRMLTGLGFDPMPDWPHGFYRCPPDFLAMTVVVSELPKGRETLMLRIWGAGRVLKEAIAELLALPEDAPERGLLLPVVLNLRRMKSNVPKTPEEKEFEMLTQPLVDQWERELLQRGRQEGLQEGRQERLKSMRRVLLELLHARFGAVDASIEARIEQGSIEELERWTTRVVVAQSAADVFG